MIRKSFAPLWLFAGDPRISSIIDGQAIRKDVGASRRIILEPLGGVGPRSPAGVAAPMTSQAKDPFKIRSQYLIQSREEIIVDVLSLLTAVTDEVAERVASTPSFAVEMPSNTPADGLESSAPPQVDFGLAGKGPVVGAVADASGAVHVEESEISADVVETVDSLIMALESMDDSGAVEASATESLIAVSAFEAAITDVVQVDPVDEIISTLESDVAPIDASEAATDEPATADEPAAVEDVIGVGGRDALQVSQPAAEVEADGDNSSDLVHAPTELSSEQLEAADAHLDTVPGEGATDVTMAPTVPVVPPDVTVVTIVPLEASTAAVIEAPALILTVDPSRTKLLAGSSLKRTVGVWKEYEENATGHRFYINQVWDHCGSPLFRSM